MAPATAPTGCIGPKRSLESKLLEKPALRQTETNRSVCEHRTPASTQPAFQPQIAAKNFEDTSPDAWLLGRAGSSPPLEDKAEAADTKIFAWTPRRPEIPLLRPQSSVSILVILLLVVFRMRHSDALPTLSDGVKQVPNEG